MPDRVDVSIVSSGHDIADARLHRHVDALRDAGICVEVLALGDLADAPLGAFARTWPRVGGARRALLAAQLARAARGRVVLTLDPDSAVAASAVCAATRRPLVVDVHEDYGALLRDRAWARAYAGLPGLIGSGVARAFDEVARRAALTLVADEHVPPLTARRRLVLRNLPSRSHLPDPSEPDPSPRALYVGDVRASRGLFAMIEALRRAPAWQLDIVGPVAGGDQDRLTELLTADPDLGQRVHLHGRRPPAQAWQHARGAWVGLMLLADTPAFRDAVPSKLGEYLACGLPVITTDLPRPAAIVRKSGAGVIVPGGSDAQVAEAVAHALQQYADRPDLLAAARERALAWADAPSASGDGGGAEIGGAEGEPGRAGERSAYPMFVQAVTDLLTGVS